MKGDFYMHGVFIEKGLMDWQIIQHENGFGVINLSGCYKVPKVAINVGVIEAHPVIRVLSEDDSSQVIPWTIPNYQPSEDGLSGTWNVSLRVPAGGLYRIETGLDTTLDPGVVKLFRGDVRLHIGVGDIFVVAGQSNSSGCAKDIAYDPPSLQVHLYRNRRQWDLACHPINESSFAADDPNAEIGVTGVSPYISFGKAFHQISHYPVGLISTALGGSPISRWDIAQKGDLFRNMIEKIRECGNKVAGILWYQGCSDAVPNQASIYFECFERLVNETRKELGYEVPFFTFQINRQTNSPYDECWGMVREAQRQAAHKIPGVYVLPTINCNLCDHIHNDAHSSIMLGEKLAKLCGNILYNAPEFFAPDIYEAVAVDKCVKVAFRNMKLGFTFQCFDAKNLGFTIKDSKGIIPIDSFSTDRNQPNTISLNLERVPEGDTYISFGWEANPTMLPPLDEVTFLPPLSFYEFPVTRG